MDKPKFGPPRKDDILGSLRRCFEENIPGLEWLSMRTPYHSDCTNVTIYFFCSSPSRTYVSSLPSMLTVTGPSFIHVTTLVHKSQ